MKAIIGISPDAMALIGGRFVANDAIVDPGETVHFVNRLWGSKGGNSRKELAKPVDEERGCWETPQWLFDELDGEFGFTLDAAATPENAKCERFFTESEDGLSQSWAGHTVWCNPPWRAKLIERWVQKAYEESRNGATVVMLIPHWGGYEWFQEFCVAGGQLRYSMNKLYFKGANGATASRDGVIVVFGPRVQSRTIGPEVRKPKKSSGKRKKSNARKPRIESPDDPTGSSGFPVLRSDGPRLSDEDLEALAGIDKRTQIVRVRIQQVADPECDQCAFCISGPGGHGKTTVVDDVLNSLLGEGNWQLHTGDISAIGVIEKFQKYAQRVHVLRDLEKCFRDRSLQAVLRAAMDTPPGGKRRIHDTKHRKRIDFEFQGAVIIESNEIIDRRYGPLGAVASRTHPLLWSLSDREMAAMMRRSACDGYEGLDPDQCMEVAEFVIQEMGKKTVETNIDLRTYRPAGLEDYLAWLRRGKMEPQWTEMIRSRIHGQPLVETRQERNERLRRIAARVDGQPLAASEKAKLFEELTGVKKTQYYEHLRIAKAAGAAGKPESRNVAVPEDWGEGV